MRIQNNTPIFKSRNKTIRYADDIARRINTCYPRISTSIVNDFQYINDFDELFQKLCRRIKWCREDISDSFDDADTFIGKILAFIKPIKTYKMGNCGESAQLTNIAAKINNIPDCYIASLVTRGGKNLDHSVLYVKNNNKPYIIDAWLGFADFVPNAIKRFEKEYRHHFSISTGDSLTFRRLKNDYTKFLNQEFKRPQINKLKKIYPELVVKKGYYTNYS